jgi:phage portal protein BeeE
MPPHRVGMLERATNNNIEQQSIEYVTYTLGPWIVADEQACAATC